MLRMEKEQAETSMSLELQTAEDTVTSLERKVSRMEELDAQLRALEEEKRSWTQDRTELEERREEVEALESQLDQTQKELEMMQRRTEVLAQQRRDSADIQGLLMRENEENRAQLEAQADELAEAKASWEAERAAWDAERETLQAGGVAKVQLDKGADALQDLMQSFGILLFSRDTSIVGLVTSIRKHLEELHSKVDAHTRAQDEWNAARAKMEEDIRLSLDKRQALFEEVEEARRARDAANAEIRSLDAQLKEISMARAATLEAETQPVVEYTGDAAKIVAALQPVWAILPSPEARAGKLGSRNFRPASPASPIMTRGGGGSLSEMDVRSLKTLYDPKGFPISSKTGAGGAFSVEAFASRVQALIADDRALIERLIRFAQAHDLLKKNAERAQKLAQESNAALETYQKQVKMLEESNMVSMAKQAALQDEVQNLQDAVERITAEKLEVETHAAEQGETCRQLTDANNKLSARALTLAEEAASASDGVRKQMEVQLSECRESLARAQQQIEEITVSQQSQQMALLEELNSVQTENTNLRTQLRKK
ncbi:hypothetical protein A0H81_09724 [Grifola frondosa]|uniref:Uncharacterized protein n=1 Tax=Grifola frondosa TaxID=5627 RepID=A0A1C7M0A8_GRIFR|nr:hypothetical protein A0H81_09724 [Grifola frondosa]